MRLFLCAALVGLALLPPTHAQVASSFGNARSTGGNRLTSSTKTGNISPYNFLGSPFRLNTLFNPFNGLTNRQTIGVSTMPAPGSAEYFKAFGYKKMF